MISNALLEVVETDQDWTMKVHKFYQSHCTWAGCNSTFGLGAHHIISRRFGLLRKLVANGVLLCEEHHSKIEAIKGTKEYDEKMILLIGKERYKFLLKLKEKYYLKEVLKKSGGTEASKVDI